MQHTGNSLLAANQGIPLPPRSPVQDVTDMFETAVELTRRVHRLVDNLAGPVPQPPANSAGSANGGLIDSLSCRARDVDELLREAQTAISRLEKLLPG